MLAVGQEYGTRADGELGAEESSSGTIGKSRWGKVPMGGAEVPQQATDFRDRRAQDLELVISAEIEIQQLGPVAQVRITVRKILQTHGPVRQANQKRHPLPVNPLCQGHRQD